MTASEPMDVLVVGGSGLVGWDLVTRTVERGHGVAYTYLTNSPDEGPRPSYQVDVRDEARVREVIAERSPDVVVHAAAMTDVDECERSPDRATEINVDGTRHVAAACANADARLLLFSTGIVFDDDGDTVREGDPRSPTNHYAATKVEAEDAVRESPVESVICRIDQPFCWPAPWQSDPFVSWTLDRLADGDPFSVFEDWYNTPVYVPDCNDTVLDLLEAGADGTYHVVGPDYLSRYEWARDVAAAFGHDPDLIKPGHSDDVDLPARRPNNHLRNDAVERETGREIRSISAALDAMAERRSDAG